MLSKSQRLIDPISGVIIKYVVMYKKPLKIISIIVLFKNSTFGKIITINPEIMEDDIIFNEDM